MAQGILRKPMDMTAETRTRKTSAQETTMRTLRTSSGSYAAARCRKPVMILYLVLTQSHQLDASRQSRSLLARKNHRRTIFSIWRRFASAFIYQRRRVLALASASCNVRPVASSSRRSAAACKAAIICHSDFDPPFKPYTHFIASAHFMAGSGLSH